jgi:RNA polymerase sigma factor (sigma-70 family)
LFQEFQQKSLLDGFLVFFSIDSRCSPLTAQFYDDRQTDSAPFDEKSNMSTKPPCLQHVDLLEHSGLETLTVFLQDSLTLYRLDKAYKPEDILKKIILYGESQASPGSIDEIQIAFLKTSGLEVIEELDRKRTANRQKFDSAIKDLFADGERVNRSFYANIARLLRQFRLSGTYEVREIIATAYALGVKRIESGNLIDIPLAWLCTTCLNVIRDLRKKQDKSDNPKIDGDLWDYGDFVFSQLMQQEDIQAIQQAMATLSQEEREILCARFVNQWSWEEVSQFLSASSDSPLLTGTVRQRGSRATTKLRQAFESVRDSVKLDDTIDYDTKESRGRDDQAESAN